MVWFIINGQTIDLPLWQYRFSRCWGAIWSVKKVYVWSPSALQLFSTTCYCIGLRKSLFMVWSWKKYKQPECGLALMSELFFQVLKNLVVPGRVSSMGRKVLKWNQWALLPTAEPKICAFVDWYSKNVLGPYMCEATPTQMFNQNLGICTQHWNSHPLLLIQ